jgi:hypothetical protein
LSLLHESTTPLTKPLQSWCVLHKSDNRGVISNGFNIPAALRLEVLPRLRRRNCAFVRLLAEAAVACLFVLLKTMLFPSKTSVK